MSFDQFIKEKKFLLNVSDCTVSWYTHALKWLPNEAPSKDELCAVVYAMRERGLKPTGCNAALRAINSYLTWSGSPHRARLLREPKEAMPTFSREQITRLITAGYDPKLKSLIMTLLDTGARISEALALRPEDVGEDTLVLHGKGGKDRVVPYSLRPSPPYPWTRHMALRLVKRQCRALGFEPPRRTLHAMRHTFALHFVRHGGGVFHLQRLLGHSTLEMSRRYANLGVADLVLAHRSPLSDAQAATR